MSDSVIIALILGIVVLGGFWIFRDKLSNFRIKTKDVDASMKTHAPKGLKVKGIKQSGEDHQVEIDANEAHIEDIEQKGKRQKTIIKPNR